MTLSAGLVFDVSASISVGFDTRGFRQGHQFEDGFYFTDSGSSGPPVLSVGTGVFISASAGIPYVATVGIEGQLKGNLFAHWHNPDHDDKLHLDELLDNLAQGPECLMDLGGSLTAQLSFFISTLFASITIPVVPEITLFDFSIFSCSPLPAPALAHVSDPVLHPENDFESHLIGPQTLIVNIGAFAGQRNPGKSVDDDERVQLFEFQPGVITVIGYGKSIEYGSLLAPIVAIYADAGVGKNAVAIDSSVTIPTTLVGGTGDDQLRGGSGKNRIIGRGGNDVLIGGIDDDIIVADVGEAKIYGGAGNDLLTAIGGSNYIDGGDDNDTIHGGTGPDNIFGGRGLDHIFGGGGADGLYGEQDADIIVGEGAQGVYIEGGSGDNIITGSDGPDTIYAVRPTFTPFEAGHNIVYAAAGNDVVHGGIDNTNVIHGGAGNDFIYGGDVNDLIHADSGIDTVFGGDGADTIFADSGTNTIYGGLGNDLIFGSSGLNARPTNWPSQTPAGFDATFAGPGFDYLYGESGNDTIYGGEASGVIDGGALGDFIYGGTGTQTIIGRKWRRLYLRW